MASGAKTDPELIQQLKDAHAGQPLVEAVVRFRADDPKEVVPSPERTEELTQCVLNRVKKHIGKSEARYNVFRNLGSFVVSAEPEFLRELISQPEVAAAVANQQSESALIPPVKKTPVPSSKPQKQSRATKKFKARSSDAPAVRAYKSAK